MSNDPVAFVRARLDKDEAERFPRPRHEIEALRAIVDLHSDRPDPDYPDTTPLCHEDGFYLPCATITALASIWRDHPDYPGD